MSDYKAEQARVSHGVTQPFQELTDAELLSAMGWDTDQDEMNDLMAGAFKEEMLRQGRDIERAVRKKNSL